MVISAPARPLSDYKCLTTAHYTLNQCLWAHKAGHLATFNCHVQVHDTACCDIAPNGMSLDDQRAAAHAIRQELDTEEADAAASQVCSPCEFWNARTISTRWPGFHAN